MNDLSGQLVSGRYRVLSMLASGGMASVYLAEDTRLERQVALKVILPHLATDSSFREKFRREAKLAAQLNHPNLVNVFDQGSDEGITYLIMEYVPGVTLRTTMSKFGPLSAAKTLEIFEPILSGLAAAHQAGILHRDIKPENIFLSDTGNVKLGDFGLARAISANTDTGSVLGTVAYISPELVLRGTADARSDIYSLGVLLFEMLTGQQPYRGEQAVRIAYQHANEDIPKPSSIIDSVPELLDEIVLWTTSREPAHRPANAKELLPVIKKARVDLARGLDTQLAEIAKTRKFAPTATGPIHRTEDSSLKTLVIEPAADVETNLTSPFSEKLRKKSRRSLLLVGLLTTIALFGSAGAGWWFGSGPGGLGIIPELAGRDLASATQALEGLDLQVNILEESSGLVGLGLVTRTIPESGGLVTKGSEISIYLSLGPEQIKVPDVGGLTLAEATSNLLELGLIPGEASYYFDSAPVGQVFALSSPMGTVVNQDSVVDIYISLGPIPELEGVAQADAIEELTQHKLSVLNISEVFNNEYAAGLVIRVIPEELPLPDNGGVSLEISKGPEIIEMPELSGETLSAAVTLLESLGFKVTVDTNQLKSNWGIAKVKAQRPESGSKIRFGDPVTVISR